MALQKQTVGINFSNGVNTKVDPFQLPIGQFLNIENSIFDKDGMLQKRNGFQALETLPELAQTATTFNGNLTAIGNSLQAYSSASNTWINKGDIVNVGVSTLPLIRSNTTQSQCDAVISPNGLVCVSYIDNIPVSGTNTIVYKYAILDSTTGQYIINPTVIPVSSGTLITPARVFLLGQYFILVFANDVLGTNHLQYIAISTTAPTIVNTEVNISTQYEVLAPTTGFDGFVANNNLYVAWNGTDVGGAIRARFLTQNLGLSNTVVFATIEASTMSVCADITGSTPIIYIVAYSNPGMVGYVIALNQNLGTVLAPTAYVAGLSIPNITSSAQNGSVNIFYEVDNTYTYNSVVTNYIQSVNVTQAGAVGSPSNPRRSIGLASKSFIIDGIIYYLVAYDSLYQPTYFLSDSSGNIIAKIAYQNGGGYVNIALPNVSVNGSSVSIPYLFKDLVEAVNKNQNAANSGLGVYAQLGVNFATFDIGNTFLSVANIANDLHLSGGFLWMYDGHSPVEHNFYLYPDNVKATPIDSVVITGNVSNTSFVITSVSSTVELTVGMIINGTGIPGGSKIVSFTNNTITIDNAATATNAGVTLTMIGSMALGQYFYQVLYAWTDNQGNVFRSAPSIAISAILAGSNTLVKLNIPTLRLTYKISNPVKIEVYRFSVNQQSYYQTTSIIMPVLNDTSIDSIEYVDTHSDAQIIGNNLIYTTGGVIENTGLPAVNAMALYKSRLFIISAEDPNLLFYSKQVIESVPVDMSDLFSIFVAPTTGAQESTGPLKCISAMDDKLVLFKKDAIYYIVGNGPDNTGANNDFSEPVFVTSTIGSLNQNSIVFIPNGLMFQSDKGIWLLGRDLSTVYIGAPVEAFNQYEVKSAINIPGTNQVRFTLSNGLTLMYDYFYNRWAIFTGIPAISSTLFESLHTYIDQYGRVFQENPGNYLDGSNPVLLSFTTGWINLAGLQGFERAYELYLLASYKSPHKLSVGIAYDYNSSLVQRSIITPINGSPLYGGNPLYGNGNLYGGPGSLEQWRVFFQKQQCQSFQITLNESYDASVGQAAGAGFTMSGLNLTIGVKKTRPQVTARQQVG